MLVYTRYLTFGKDFYFSVTCPKCNNESPFEVYCNLEDLDYCGLSEEAYQGLQKHGYNFAIPIELIKSQRSVLIGFISRKDQANVERVSQESKGEINTLSLLARLKHISGEDSPGKRKRFVEHLPVPDAEYIKEISEKHDIYFQDTVERKCKHCHREISIPLPVDMDFFSKVSTVSGSAKSRTTGRTKKKFGKKS